MNRGIVILGATGSVGRSALAVVETLRERFHIVGLTAHSNAPLLGSLIKQFHPRYAAIVDKEQARILRSGCPEGTEVLEGIEGVLSVAAAPDADIVVSAIVGAAGLRPILEAIEQGKTIALANKEPLVMAGSIIMSLAEKHNATVLPIESEHNAISQCLEGNKEQEVHKILLTASGGPFYGSSADELEKVTPEDAIAHPTWDMGAKISVDSATLMNKGLEVIEAHWLFGVDIDNIEVVIHPSSIVHSMVEFVDGSILAQLSRSDMKLPIQYALTYPERIESRVERLNITEVSPLEFFSPSLENFPCLGLAYEAARTGGTMPAVLNAANEVAVDRFLNHDLSFSAIPKVIEQVMEEHVPVVEPTLNEVLAADKLARESAATIYRSF